MGTVNSCSTMGLDSNARIESIAETLGARERLNLQSRPAASPDLLLVWAGEAVLWPFGLLGTVIDGHFDAS